MASLAKRANEVILKVVNVSAADQETDLRLEGAKSPPDRPAIVLASDKPEDENTLDQPRQGEARHAHAEPCRRRIPSYLPRQLGDRAAPEAKIAVLDDCGSRSYAVTQRAVCDRSHWRRRYPNDRSTGGPKPRVH